MEDIQQYFHLDNGLNPSPLASPGPQFGASTNTPPPTHPVSQSTAALLSEPWLPEVRLEFLARFTSTNPTYKNKLRLSASAESRIRYFLTHPHASPIPNNPTDARLKNRSKSFMLAPPSPSTAASNLASLPSNPSSFPPNIPTSSSSPALYRTDGSSVRRHINEAEIWDFLTGEHTRSGHKGRDRMLATMRNDYIGYTLEELMFVLQSCRVCRAAKTTAGATAEGEEDEVRTQLRQNLGKAAATLRAGHWQVGQAAPARYGVLGDEEQEEDEDEGDVWERAERAFRMMAVGGHEVREAPRKSLYAPDDATGLVQYDVPDWYS